MTQPISGKAPPPHIESTAKTDQDKLNEVADKVSQVTGVPAQKVTQATPLMPATTALPSQDTEKATAEVKKTIELTTLLNMPAPVRQIFLSNLSDNDLQAFEIAISKGTALPEKIKPAFENLKKQFKQIKQNRIQEILADHPNWRSQVEAWKNVSLEDTIWLLQLYELRNFDVNLPEIDALCKGNEFIPSEKSLDLLRPETRKKIQSNLLGIQQLAVCNKGLNKCPNAIYLLVNLQRLYLNSNNLTVSPDLSRFPNLEIFYMSCNQLVMPPDVSRNLKLKHLQLDRNKLISSPDVSTNIELEDIHLGSNQIKSPPNVQRNVKLKSLSVSENQLNTPPDVSQNVLLEGLYLFENQLTSNPNLSRNVKLKYLNMRNNRLTTLPDISNNIALEYADLRFNQFTEKDVVGLLSSGLQKKYPNLRQMNFD